MKKIFSSFVAALASLALFATTTSVWTGAVVLGDAENDISVAAEDVSTLAVNDFIAVTITDMVGDYCQLNIAGNNPWTSIPGTEWNSFSEVGTLKFQVTDADLVTNITTSGMTLQGKFCTVTEIAIVSDEGDDDDDDDDDEETTIEIIAGVRAVLFEDAEGVAMSWNEICEQPAEVGALLEEKDSIIITVSAKSESVEWPKAILRDNASAEVANVLLNEVSTFPHEVVFALSAEEVAAIQEGFRISGDGITIIKVEAAKYVEPEPIIPEELQPGEEKELWAGEETLSWNEVAAQDAMIGALLADKDTLFVTVSAKGAVDWPKVLLRDLSSTQVGNEVLFNDVELFPAVAAFALNEAMVEALAPGFSVCGDGVTVTRLVLKKYLEGEPEKEIDYTDLVETVVWESNTAVAISWNSEEWAGTQFDTRNISETLLAGLQMDNIIRVQVAEAEENAEMQLQYKLGEEWSWTTIENIHTETEGEIAYRVPTDEMAMVLADRGLVVTGIRYSINKISIFAPEVISAVQQTNITLSDGIRRNILGMEVDENYRGVVIINGKKILQ